MLLILKHNLLALRRIPGAPVFSYKTLYFTAIVYLSAPAYLIFELHFVLQNGLQWRTSGIRTSMSYVNL